MDIRKEQRKLKALSILEKVKKFEKMEILNKYHQALDVKKDVIASDEKLKALLSTTESDIKKSIQSNCFNYLESLPLKSKFLEDLHLSKSKSSRYLSEMNSKSTMLLELLGNANAHQQLISEKYEDKLSSYRKSIIAKGDEV